MSILRCEVCGGELEINQDMTIGVCKYCDSVNIIPKEPDRREKLYNRAVFLRQNNEFDKAASAYEDMLKEDNEDAVAHWGLVLSRYGIEYVSDPKTQEWIPTCHRTQYKSILADPDYLAAIENADFESRSLLEEKARQIHEIQANIIKVSQKELPYDIFICYKEEDEHGERTEDSTLAQDLYYELRKKEYKVFFARKTLENKLGTEYEPIIFSALNTAKVMIVLGTKKEYFNAVWVKNEWSRFSEMSKVAEKYIIPAYRGMSPYELPDELSVLQSLDMSKIGFMQDLTDGIERFIRGENKRKDILEETVSGLISLERLVKNGETYLKLNNLERAKEVYITITTNYPEDYRGWWGLIICETCNFTKVLSHKEERNSIRTLFGYVKQLAPNRAYQEVEEEYVEYIRKESMREAKEDIKTVKGIIKKHDSEMREKNQDIQSQERIINRIKEDYRQQQLQDDQEINTKNSQITETKLDLKEYERNCIIAVFLIVGGTFMIFAGGILIVVGLLIGGLGITLVAPGEKHKERILQKEEELSVAEQNKAEHEATYLEELERENRIMKGYEDEVELINDKINNCEKYLELGEEKIATFWFSKACELFDIQKSYDPLIKEYRDAVFGINAITSEGNNTKIICPACGELFNINDDIKRKGHCTCVYCGTKIELEMKM